VVGLGAICELEPRRSLSAQSFSVSEFVTLEDGRRIILHEERGFTTSWMSTDSSDATPIQPYETADMLKQDVLNVVLPDDDNGEDHPWDWLASRARARGLDVNEGDLRGLPYDVVLSDDVMTWLASF
jgi:hypothetical protein